MGPRALEDLTRALSALGYAPHSQAAEVGGVGVGEGEPELELKVGEALSPEALNALLQGVANWIRQRPPPRGRFRKKKPRPVSVTVFGPNGALLGRSIVERG
jgi:hypothetical protein